MFSLHWYFLISSYYLTVSNGCSLTALKSIEVTQSSGSFKGGTICLWYLHAFGIYMFSLHWYFLISSYYLTVSNGCSLTALKSVEVTQSSGSFNGGTICLWYLHAFGIYMFSLHWYFLISSYYLTVLNGRSLTALKSVEVTQSSDSFILGGTICLWYLYPYIYWYFLIFSNKLTAFGIYMFSLHWYFLISSYYLTVSNGCSLTALKSIEVTQSSGSFKGGGPSAFGICMPLVSTCFLCTGISLYLPII